MIYGTYEAALAAMSNGTVETVEGLKPQQTEQYRFYESQVATYGLYDPGILANGAHYGPNSPFADQGLICANCVFYRENACEIVSGQIAAKGICKFWIIPESYLQDSEQSTDQTAKLQELLMSGMTNEEIIEAMPGATVEDIVSAAADAARSN